MIGTGEDHMVRAVEDAIKKNGVENNIILPGFVKNVEDYYLDAGVLMSTSAFEGFSMVFLESCSFGVPIVTYAMDYLELIRSCRSISR